ncbi:MAG: alginate lyase family protein [Fibrobacter sp.]|nr:alginate lyase family protein [Fibrobacter sp.]
MPYPLLIILLLVAPNFAQFLWSESHLTQVRQSLQRENSPYKEAFIVLETKAKSMQQQAPVSVMEKKHTPASGDKHDYASLSRYFWPDSSKPDGLPYISRDGVSNPELEEYDRNTLESMSQRIRTLTLAWFLGNDTTFASSAVAQIRTWFIDESTRMNPNMNYAQMIPGRNNGKGYPFGVLDGYSFVEMIDALWLLQTYPGYTNADQAALRAWFTKYVLWLTTSEQALEESRASNNHGTTYDTQLLAYSLFIGDRHTAQGLVDKFAQRHILKQIERDGKQPKELKRTLAYHYSWYNLSHMLDFYIIAKNHGLDISRATEIQGRSFYKALDFLAKYIGKDVSMWPYQQISNWEQTQRNLIRDLLRTELFISPERKNYRKIFVENKKQVEHPLFNLLYAIP